jgi:hypothetical protein
LIKQVRRLIVWGGCCGGCGGRVVDMHHMFASRHLESSSTSKICIHKNISKSVAKMTAYSKDYSLTLSTQRYSKSTRGGFCPSSNKIRPSLGFLIRDMMDDPTSRAFLITLPPGKKWICWLVDADAPRAINQKKSKL